MSALTARLVQLFNRTGSKRVSVAAATGTCVLGLLVVFGNVIGSSILTSIRESWISTRPITAVCLFLLGLAVIAISRRWLTLAATCTMSVVAAMILATLSQVVCTLLSDSDVGQSIAQKILHSTPSVGTTLGFILSSCGLFVWLVGNGPLRPIRRACAILTFAIGLVAISGYALGHRMMSWGMEEFSLPMAFLTGVGFMLVGIAIHEIEFQRVPTKVDESEELPDWSKPEHTQCRRQFARLSARIDHLERKLDEFGVNRS